MKRLPAIVTGLAVLFAAALVHAQGVLIVVNPSEPVPLPRPIVRPAPPPMSYKIKELAVQARVVDQVARVQLSQSFVNTGSRQMEVQFVFPLPYDGAVDQLTLLVDGKEYPAKLLPAAEARSIYEGYIRRNQDPALLEWMGTGMFRTSVFPVPPGAERTVTMRYSQLLRKDRNLTDFLFPLGTAKYTSHPVEKVEINVAIESGSQIMNVYSPTHSVEIHRPDSHHATVKLASTNDVPVSDFRLFYDVAPGTLGASVISYRPEAGEDGYFLLLASPEVKTAESVRPPKNVVLVLDRSGSMSGKKIEQAKEALKFVLGNLREGDLFNIVAYDSNVETFQPELQRYDDESRKRAMGFAEGIYAGGGTNIDGAMSKALAMLQDSKRPSFVIFLTDGLPTAGETNEGKIVANAGKNNQVRARVITFGVGYDVNSRLLDRISAANFGQSEYVRPNENIEAHVSRLYNKISSPVMVDVAVNLDVENIKVEEGAPVNRVYPRLTRDLFEGEQLVLVGRYKKAGAAKVVITGKVGSDERKFDFPATLAESSSDESYAFVEKLWALRRIGEIIDEIDLAGGNDELVKELVALSTRHGILTPYTSFLADDQPGGSPLARGPINGRENLDRARQLLERLGEAGGQAGFAQRAEKKAFKEAANTPLASKFAGQLPAQPADPASTTGSAPPPGTALRDIDKDEATVLADVVQNVGNETLYKRGKTWIAANAADVDPEKDADKIQTIERFSEEYFKLTSANTSGENAILARQQPGEEILVKLRGQVYLIK
jgi:Ca-activated chloride channel family protein